jgi:tripartite-type tricarboxylate transporter receptor subunit TctC
MTLHRRDVLRLVAAMTALPTFVGSARAQNYPTRTVHIIVPLGAGSAADILTRQLAQEMSERWSQPVIVENRPGAGTVLGATEVARAAPDGHTLLANSASFAVSAVVNAKLPYDPLKDFAPISQIARAPMVFVVAPSLGVKSINAFIEHAKAQSAGVAFGSPGVGTGSHFAAEQFRLAAGFTAVHVPYKGPAEVLVDTAAERVQFAISPLLPALPFFHDGRLLPLGVTTAQRSPLLPDVPTIAEGGLSGFEYQDWWGVFAPAATPHTIIDTINSEMRRILEKPEVVAAMLKQGVQARPSTPGEFIIFVRGSINQARDVANRAGIQPR